MKRQPGTLRPSKYLHDKGAHSWGIEVWDGFGWWPLWYSPSGGRSMFTDYVVYHFSTRAEAREKIAELKRKSVTSEG